MADMIKAAGAKASNFSPGSTSQATGTAGSSAPSETPRPPVKQPGRRRARRKVKVAPGDLLSIAQSALARLTDAGFKVYVINHGESLIITVLGAKVEDKKFKIRDTMPGKEGEK